MKIEIKNIKHSEFASEETHCFEATVYVDGKREFIASNDGHGGPDNYHPLKGGSGKQVWDRVKEINDILSQEQVDVMGDGKHFISNSLEIVIGDLMNLHLGLKNIKSKLRRRIMAVNAEGVVYEYKADPKKTSPEAIKKLEKDTGYTVLNGLPDDQLQIHLKKFLSQ